MNKIKIEHITEQAEASLTDIVKRRPTLSPKKITDLALKELQLRGMKVRKIIGTSDQILTADIQGERVQEKAPITRGLPKSKCDLLHKKARAEFIEKYGVKPKKGTRLTFHVILDQDSL